MHKWLKTAVAYAREHDFHEGLSYQLCAILVRGGSILSIGYNRRNRNGFIDYVKRSALPGLQHEINVHAEVDAVLQVRNKIDLTGCKLYVARIKPTGIGLARPCDGCQFVAQRYGIRKATYTISETEYGVLKI